MKPICALAIGLAVWSAKCEDGVFADRIVLGQSCVLKGPAAALGTHFREGMLSALMRVNQDGGVNGRRIDLVTYDDGYEPRRCEENVQKLIREDRVFCLIGGVGTPTSLVAVPICEEAKVPFVAPFTGAAFLRAAGPACVVNLRASYAQEAERMARHFVDKLGLKKIACFYQDDPFGRSGLEGIWEALQRRKLDLVAKATYPRNTIAVAKPLIEFAAMRPDAVVMVGTYRPCAAFVKAARGHEAYKDTLFCHYSFVGANDLFDELGSLAEGVMLTQVVPNPEDAALPVVREFLEDPKNTPGNSKIQFVRLEGYLAAKFVCQALKAIPGEPTRARFLSIIREKKNFDLGGFPLEFGPSDNQGSDQVFLSVFKNGKCATVAE